MLVMKYLPQNIFEFDLHSGIIQCCTRLEQATLIENVSLLLRYIGFYLARNHLEMIIIHFAEPTVINQNKN